MTDIDHYTNTAVDLGTDEPLIAATIKEWFTDHTDEIVHAITAAVIRQSYAQRADKEDAPEVVQILSILSDGHWHLWSDIAEAVLSVHEQLDYAMVFEIMRRLGYAHRIEKRGSWQRKTKTCPASDTREARLISSTASGHAIDKDD